LTLPLGQTASLIAEVENLIPIGQFSEASRLSPKALRLYDDNGLLPPARVDPDSGYRYYHLRQLEQASMIRLLRRAGMPLGEIRAFLADPSAARLDGYERTLLGELADRRLVLRYLRRRLKEETMFKVETKRVEAQRYVSRTKSVRVAELERFINETISELWKANQATGSAFSVYHGEVNEEDDGPVEVGVPTADGDKRLPAGEVAFTIATGDQCRFPEIIGAYDAVARWAKENGRELDGSPREIYHSDPEKGEEDRFEIAWPIR
jgi:DNA-binding transcriptional MerR regulator